MAICDAFNAACGGISPAVTISLASRPAESVARKLTHQVSTRNYAAANDDGLAGYGIHKSSVSRPWKAATAAERRKLVQRPVPSNLVALLIDGQSFRKDCLIVAFGGR